MYTVKVSKEVVIKNGLATIEWTCLYLDGEELKHTIVFETNEKVTKEDVIEKVTPAFVSLEKHKEASDAIVLDVLIYDKKTGKIIPQN